MFYLNAYFKCILVLQHTVLEINISYLPNLSSTCHFSWKETARQRAVAYKTFIREKTGRFSAVQSLCVYVLSGLRFYLPPWWNRHCCMGVKQFNYKPVLSLSLSLPPLSLSPPPLSVPVFSWRLYQKLLMRRYHIKIKINALDGIFVFSSAFQVHTSASIQTVTERLW